MPNTATPNATRYHTKTLKLLRAANRCNAVMANQPVTAAALTPTSIAEANPSGTPSTIKPTTFHTPAPAMIGTPMTNDIRTAAARP